MHNKIPSFLMHRMINFEKSMLVNNCPNNQEREYFSHPHPIKGPSAPP